MGIETKEKEVFISSTVEAVYKELLKNDKVKEGLAFLEADNEFTAKEQTEITEIPAPTFQEEERGKDFKKRLEALGIQNISVDEVGNVFGVRPGTGKGPKLVVCGHLDTVFPEGTDVKARIKDGIIYAPGIGDDGRGLASVLTLIRSLNHANIQTEGDIIIGANVGEEGLGDLRGMKALFKNRHDIDGFISIEPGSPERTTYLGVGSKRYSITFKGPGGHSYGAFGTPSPIHALTRAGAKIADLQVPNEPKTTFNIGLISGGTSVNTISETANMVIDLRSSSQEQLLSLESTVLAILNGAVEEENKRWNADVIKVEIKLVGDRPAGSQSIESMAVQASLAATKGLGFEPILAPAGSTDSNVPINLGIPAVTLGGGGETGGTHTLDEWFNPKDAYYGVQKILLTILGLVGVAECTEPLLEIRGK
ncbi:M20/M25/M40 family metallo-hydrolase [Robertmurraya massiliosenegalensis]|uniref:M20/M25/M40 family metallo-hydrolase n=1 Tax=Robertmurraya massiliosenegalensis TaxID=1287657 RepID=UPI0002D636AF|nr:M20/M25/M40 family metallo-hydrolase [Robertmurraya massiliosenegalensis]